MGISGISIASGISIEASGTSVESQPRTRLDSFGAENRKLITCTGLLHGLLLHGLGLDSRAIHQVAVRVLHFLELVDLGLGIGEVALRRLEVLVVVRDGLLRGLHRRGGVALDREALRHQHRRRVQVPARHAREDAGVHDAEVLAAENLAPSCAAERRHQHGIAEQNAVLLAARNPGSPPRICAEAPFR